MGEDNSSSVLNKFLGGALVISGFISLFSGVFLTVVGYIQQGTPDEVVDFFIYSLLFLVSLVGFLSLYYSISFFRGNKSLFSIRLLSFFQSLLFFPPILIFVFSDESLSSVDYYFAVIVVVFSLLGVVLITLSILSLFVPKSSEVQEKTDSKAREGSQANRSTTKPSLSSGLAVAGLFAVIIIGGYYGSGSFGSSEEEPSCKEISGVYEGLFEPKVGDRSLAQMTIQPDCEYEVIRDVDDDGDFSDSSGKDVWTSGSLQKRRSGQGYALENGGTVTVRESTVRYSDVQANGTLQWQRNVR